MSTRAMIFDFDGTIADTFVAVVTVLNSLAGEFGYRVATPDELPVLRSLRPIELAQAIGLAWPQVPRLVARVRKEMARNMAAVAPFSGIPQALGALRERGIRLGMLTSNSRENVEIFLAHNPSLQFDFVSTGSGLFSKQHRLKRVLRRERLHVSEVCYVGDEVRDIEAAQAVGARMVAVTWGFSAAQLLAASKPEHLIAEPAELLTVV
jgi:HAD superfamily hydrolase (TIGR01549 family)